MKNIDIYMPLNLLRLDLRELSDNEEFENESKFSKPYEEILNSITSQNETDSTNTWFLVKIESIIWNNENNSLKDIKNNLVEVEGYNKSIILVEKITKEKFEEVKSIISNFEERDLTENEINSIFELRNIKIAQQIKINEQDRYMEININNSFSVIISS
jgi:hypothetical protein